MDMQSNINEALNNVIRAYAENGANEQTALNALEDAKADTPLIFAKYARTNGGKTSGYIE